jgi:starch synthase
MRILFVASEAYPLIKTGGLADVAGALPAALAALGMDVRILLPAYPAALDGAPAKGPSLSLGDLLGAGEVRLIPARMPDSGVALWLVDCPALFHRRGNPYVDIDGNDWPDNHLRFAVLARAAARIGEIGERLGWAPDVIHGNDWQCGLIPAYLAFSGGRRPATVMAIHNLQYRGLFDPKVGEAIGLPPQAYAMEGAEFYGQLSYLKAGLFYADRLTTVSPTYAREIQRPEFGWGLQGLLAKRAHDLVGILNGVDRRLWNPAADPHLARPYSAQSLRDKAVNKAALQAELGLAPWPEAPLFGIVSRFTEQKGLDLVLAALPALFEMGGQLAVLGSGERHLEDLFRQAAQAQPQRVALRLAYDEGLAHRIEAGADMLLVPSRFEPCGLTQMYALAYGTAPVVRRTGGLADTVQDAGEPGGGTGFMFDQPTPLDLIDAMGRGVGLYRQPQAWRAVQLRGMAQDFSWERAAVAHRDLYRDLAPLA